MQTLAIPKSSMHDSCCLELPPLNRTLRVLQWMDKVTRREYPQGLVWGIFIVVFRPIGKRRHHGFGIWSIIAEDIIQFEYFAESFSHTVALGAASHGKFADDSQRGGKSNCFFCCIAGTVVGKPFNWLQCIAVYSDGSISYPGHCAFCGVRWMSVAADISPPCADWRTVCPAGGRNRDRPAQSAWAAESAFWPA